MAEPNDQLRRARERTQSPYSSGDFLSRQELAELVNAWVFKNTEDHRVIDLDANYVGKLEQGTIRWPQDPDRRAGFRAVLGVKTRSWGSDVPGAAALPWWVWTASSSSAWGSALAPPPQPVPRR